jgi:hypothetical protein
MTDFDQLKNVVETWAIQRVKVKEFNRADLDRWCQAMNDRTRHVIHLWEIRDPTFYQRIATESDTVMRYINEGKIDGAKGRMLMAQFEVWDVDFYSALTELCVNASTMLTKSAKIVADGKDVTNL